MLILVHYDIGPMYAAPKIYDNVVVAEPNISMYKVAPIYDDVMVSGEDTDWAADVGRRQDRCLSELELLRQRLVKLEVGLPNVLPYSKYRVGHNNRNVRVPHIYYNYL